MREEWEHAISSKENANSQPSDDDASSDAYCFELLSMVLALSGSNVGRQYLAQQLTLLQDLFSLLHTASPRVQRQVGGSTRVLVLNEKIVTKIPLFTPFILSPPFFCPLCSFFASSTPSSFSFYCFTRHSSFLPCLPPPFTFQVLLLHCSLLLSPSLFLHYFLFSLPY